jgi:hypothetical protein
VSPSATTCSIVIVASGNEARWPRRNPLGRALPLALGGGAVRDPVGRQIRGRPHHHRMDGVEELGHDRLVVLGRRGRAVRGSGCRLLRGGAGWAEQRQ